MNMIAPVENPLRWPAGATIMEMTGHKIELFVRDLETSARFYEEALGFRREPKRQVEADGRILEHLPLRHGHTIVALGLLDRLPQTHPIMPRSQDERVGLGFEFCFYVAEDELDAWHDRARAAGDHVVHHLAARPWGARDFRMLDPDGYYVRVSGPDTDQRANTAVVSTSSMENATGQTET